MSQVTSFSIPASPLTMSTLATTLEAAFAALGSCNRGSTAPSNPFEGMLWWDSSANPEVLKRYTVTGGWATILSVNITTGALSINPAGVDDASANAAAMQTTADPFPGGSESLATTLSGELQRLRYIVQQITGMAQWYHDPVGEIFVPASQMIEWDATYGAKSGGANGNIYKYMAFEKGTERYAQFNLVMPPDWNLGTIKAKVYWSSATGSTAGDTVEWEIRAIAVSNDDALDVTWGTAQVISDALLANNGADLQVSGATPAITIGGTPAPGDLVNFLVSRNISGTDDMAEAAWLFGILIQYTKGSTAGAAW